MELVDELVLEGGQTIFVYKDVEKDRMTIIDSAEQIPKVEFAFSI